MKYDEEYKKNAVKLSYASTKSVAEISSELGIKNERLYAWRRKYTAEGEKTPQAKVDEELKSLRLQVAELTLECDMLKKATAYFANLKR